MKQELAEATVKKLESDKRVNEAKVCENDKGIYVEARARDRMAAQKLQQDLGSFPVFVDVVA
jgi:hypothetical protein